VGIQIETRTLGGQSKTQYIDANKVVDVVIVESIKRHQVRFYLTILMEDRSQAPLDSNDTLGARGRAGSIEGAHKVIVLFEVC
jgi:hypothetical protein